MNKGGWTSLICSYISKAPWQTTPQYKHSSSKWKNLKCSSKVSCSWKTPEQKEHLIMISSLNRDLWWVFLCCWRQVVPGKYLRHRLHSFIIISSRWALTLWKCNRVELWNLRWQNLHSCPNLYGDLPFGGGGGIRSSSVLQSSSKSSSSKMSSLTGVLGGLPILLPKDQDKG